ncbi:glycosyltransferase family 2 protein [Brunnivagina elsteri]|uniref:Glycosyl transferase n=1 Tax=Brunnivagina elsteri CCALA 953 TaxID=987040 RepID=A0A2A2TJ16_9CYAN|nr:glycosyltransferase family 2 protein [Calothrix elsteri]PAX53987.1 glycosyl transferase [Calothrix elsteri CCALA 953]
MKFSVVITTYNRLNLLRRAIDSALEQSIPCEVVVADDCSLDDTQSYVETLQHELSLRGDFRLIYCRSSINLGHAATVNAGVEKSSGDWIKFLDDDDYLAPNCLEEMENAIAIHPDAAICSCIAAQVSENGEEFSRTPQLGPGLAYYIPQADIHYGMLLEILPFGTPVQVACDRKAFLKAGGWDTTMTSCDDIDSWIRIAQFGDGIFLNQCLAFRTIWSGGLDQKIALQQRLHTNILMKEKIYALVDAKHHGNIPALQDMRHYLQLHWTLVAIRTKNITNILKIIDTSILSFHAWRLLVLVALVRRSRHNNIHLRKFVLIN